MSTPPGPLPPRTSNRHLPAQVWAARFTEGCAGLSALQERLLVALSAHRLLTAAQLRELHAPRTRQSLTRSLSRLRHAGLAATTPVHGARATLAWWATPAGRDRVAAAIRPRPFTMTADRADSQLQRHTLLANQIGVEFTRHARAAGHGLGVLDWDNEIAHRIRDGELDARSMLVSDLRIRFMVHDGAGDAAVARLVEADRGTETVLALAEKVRGYCRLLTYVPDAARRAGDTVPGWRRQYVTFPQLVIVFDGHSERALRRRTRQLLELCRSDPLTNQHLADLGLLCTTFEQLSTHGPFAPIFTTPAGQPVDILAEPGAEQERSA